MPRPTILDLRPNARTSHGLPALGGILLAGAGVATLVAGVRRGRIPGGILALLGAGMAYRGLTGMGLVARLVDPRAATQPVQFPATESTPRDHRRSASITISRDREPVYLFWRDPANLTLLQGPVEGITVTDARQRWRLSGPAGPPIELDMRTVEDVPLERVAWEATGTTFAVGFSGPLRVSVALSDAPGDRGTEVRLTLQLPGGPLSGAIERFFGPALETQLRESLRHARMLLEAGEIPTTHGQPSGRRADRSEDTEDAAEPTPAGTT